MIQVEYKCITLFAGLAAGRPQPNPMAEHRHRGPVHGSVSAYEGVSEAYERGRPAYPEAVLARIVERSRIGPGSRVLDLAAGSGKFTRQLLATGARVQAVEPVAAFRKRLRELPVGVLDGTAEALPLDDASVDLVTVAAAFHWFDAPRALEEVGRVLRRGGMLAILWNERDQRDNTQFALTELIEPHRRGEPRQVDESWLAAFDAASGFTELEKEDFAHPHRFTPDSLVERVNSISFVAALPEQTRAALIERVRELAATRGRTFELPHITHLYMAKRLRRRGCQV